MSNEGFGRQDGRTPLEDLFVCMAPISQRILLDAFAQIQLRGEKVEKVLAHPLDYADLLKPGLDLPSNLLTKAQASEMLHSGVFPSKLFGAEVERSLTPAPGEVEVWSESYVVFISVVR